MTTTLTLWRGEQLLGRLLERTQPGVIQPADRPPTLSAFLLLCEDAPLPEGVWQIHPFFGMGVQQDPIEPEVFGDRRPRTSKHQSSGALEPVPPEKMAGVPREIQLTIRNDKGRVWLPRLISIRELRYRPEDIERVSRDTPAEALMNGSIWFVFAAFDSDADAPDA